MKAEKAAAFAADLPPLITQLEAQGLSLRAIAAELTRQGVTTPRGSTWTAPGVKRVVERMGRWGERLRKLIALSPHMAYQDNIKATERSPMAIEQEKPTQLSKRPQMARYVVFVDHQAKRSFDTREAAENEAQRIKKAFPVVVVEVVDEDKNSVNTLGPISASSDKAEDGG